jgi:phosphatidylglycerophosphatase A
MKLKDEHILFFATGAYTGKVPFAPGTFGAIAAIPLYIILSFLFTPELWPVFTVFLVAFIVFAVWIAERAVAILGADDPGCVVIDEIAGFLVTMAGFECSWKSVILGFLFFRIFDILKPFPVKYLEENLPGGAGVVLDDVAAGIMAHAVLAATLALF